MTTVFSKEGGWPYGDTEDTDPQLFENEKKIVGSNPVHDASSLPNGTSEWMQRTDIAEQTNVMIVEKGKELGVKIINVVVSVICKSTSQW